MWAGASSPLAAAAHSAYWLAGWLTEASSLAHWLPLAARRAAFKDAPLFRAVYLLSFPFSVLGRPLLFLPGAAACPESRAAQLLHIGYRVQNGRKYSGSDLFRFLFLSLGFRICGSRFRIYGSRNEISPSVSEESRFYMELTRIYFIFNLYKICLKINMFKITQITKYAC